MKLENTMVDELVANLQIDKHNLDAALETQASSFHFITGLLEVEINRRDSIKVDIENAEAELQAKFRKWATEDKERVTDAAINARVNNTKRMKRLKEDLLQSKLECGKLSALKESYVQRGYVLNSLCSLYQANYYVREAGGHAEERYKDGLANRNRKEAGALQTRLIRERAERRRGIDQ